MIANGSLLSIDFPVLMAMGGSSRKSSLNRLQRIDAVTKALLPPFRIGDRVFVNEAEGGPAKILYFLQGNYAVVQLDDSHRTHPGLQWYLHIDRLELL